MENEVFANVAFMVMVLFSVDVVLILFEKALMAMATAFNGIDENIGKVRWKI